MKTGQLLAPGPVNSDGLPDAAELAALRAALSEAGGRVKTAVLVLRGLDRVDPTYRD